MSWSLQHNGSPAAVTAAIDGNSALPSGVKALVKEMVNSIALGTPVKEGAIIAQIATNGHFDSKGGSATFSVSRMALLPEPFVAPSPPPTTPSP